MKKLLSAALALAMLLTVIAPVFAAPVSGGVWNDTKKQFELSDGPTITAIEENTNRAGTEVHVWCRHSEEYWLLEDRVFANDDNGDRLFAEVLGMDVYDAEGDWQLDGYVHMDIQYAYRFDGNTEWVNDWAPERDPENPYYEGDHDFDLDGDGYDEYVNLPTHSVSYERLMMHETLIYARGGAFTPNYIYPGDYTVREAMQIRNNALLQGVGEHHGTYDPDAEGSDEGFSIDFSRHTLHVKARYRVYQDYSYRVDGEWTKKRVVTYSGWGPEKTFNNANRSFEGQGVVPDAAAFRDTNAPTLEIIGTEREKFERDGVEMTRTYYRVAVRFTDELKNELAKFIAMDDGAQREQITGEWYRPNLVYEIKVGSGEWYILNKENDDRMYYEFCDDTYWIRDEMEALGYRPDDPVYLRARLAGYGGYDEQRDEAVGYDTFVPTPGGGICTAVSNAIELNLTGKYKVNYELNGGAFASGSEQLTQFDDETDVTVDLTAADYTPARKHFVFKGWFADAAFTKPVTSFDTKLKASRTYYAKWEELPYFTLTYDYGIVTGDVYNHNPDRIYSDSGEAHNGVIALENVSYAGVDFLGWYDAPEGGNKIESLSFAALTGSITLYAHWNVPTFTITYTGAGTDYTNNAKNPATYQVSPAGGTQVWLYAPEKTGYIFDGWFLNADLTHDGLFYDAEKDAWLLDESSNVTVYAKFIRGRWNVNYVLGLNDAWNGANPEKHTYGEAVTLKAPSRTGYTFEGWFTDAAFTQPISVIPADTVGEITVYAKWTAIIYTVEYDLRDPDVERCFGNPNPTTRTVDEEIVLQPLTPTTGLYRFMGWFDNVNFDGDPIKVISKGTDRNMRLYANVEKYLWGDVNFDGQVTTGDARLVLRAAVGLDEFTAEQAAWGDLEKHSAAHEIGTGDARRVLRMAIDLDTAESLGLPEVPEGF